MPRKNKKNAKGKNKHVIKHKKLSKKQDSKGRILKSRVPLKKNKKVIKQKQPLPESKEQQSIQQQVIYLSQSELEEFRNLLINRRNLIEEMLKNRANDLTKSSVKDDTGNLSGVPQHLAEMGSQEYDKDFACIMLESIQKELKEIYAALEKFNHNSYGICENCNKPINKERLKVLPYTRLCLDCKILEENSGINI